MAAGLRPDPLWELKRSPKSPSRNKGGLRLRGGEGRGEGGEGRGKGRKGEGKGTWMEGDRDGRGGEGERRGSEGKGREGREGKGACAVLTFP